MHVKFNRWILCIALLITLIYPSPILADTLQEPVQSTVVDPVDSSIEESPVQEKEVSLMVLGSEKDLDRFHISKPDLPEWGEENPEDNGETGTTPKNKAPKTPVKKGKWVNHHKYSLKKKSIQNKSLTLAPVDPTTESADNNIEIMDVDAIDSSEEMPDVPEKGFWAWVKIVAKATRNVFVGIGNWMVSLLN